MLPPPPHLQAARLFGRIRQTVACQAAPATLKSAFLEPVSTQLAAELSVEILGRSDEQFMTLFTGGWLWWGWEWEWGGAHVVGWNGGWGVGGGGGGDSELQGWRNEDFLHTRGFRRFES